MAVTSAKLDRRVRFMRAVQGDDGYGNTILAWAYHGSPVAASRRDISDAEKISAGRLAATVTARFVVRKSSFSVGITPADRLETEGARWEIDGIKEVFEPRHGFLEITATKGDVP